MALRSFSSLSSNRKNLMRLMSQKLMELNLMQRTIKINWKKRIMETLACHHLTLTSTMPLITGKTDTDKSTSTASKIASIYNGYLSSSST